MRQSGGGINEKIILSMGAGLIDDFIRDILSVPFCPYHFVHTILHIPFCPYHFIHTTLSIPFCTYHFVRYHFVLEPNRVYIYNKYTSMCVF